MTGIYKITNKYNDKCYIGKSKDIMQRWAVHERALLKNNHHSIKMQEDFNTYGFDSFKIIIYDTESNNLLEDEKQKQISIGIPNLYNERISGYYIDEEYRKKLASSDKSSHRTKEYRENMRKLKSNKIAQYTLDMKLIKIWDSSKDICDELHYTRSVILSCCNKSKPHGYGYNWRYVDDNGNILESGYIKARKNKH